MTNLNIFFFQEDTLNDVFLIENETSDNQELFEKETGFGNIAVIGNRIEVQVF